jgi:1-deoxy-D-xylulose-5-phosphate reductoisomerase
MVAYTDGAVKAQLGMPDMKVPIAYALSFPDRMTSRINPRIDWREIGKLTFEQPDMVRFPNLRLAFEAMAEEGNAPCVLNAANEVAVAAFLEGRCGFMQMPTVIERTLERVGYIKTPTLDDYIASDAEARRIAREELGL